MLAARAYAGERAFRLEDIETPEPGPGEVLVRVRSAGLPRSLLALWYFAHQMYPMTPGHEFAGVVIAAGPGVAGDLVGQRVRVRPGIPCRACGQCLLGRADYCTDLATIGYALYGERGRANYLRYRDGGLAEFARVPATAVVPLPDTIAFAVGAKLGTVAGAYRAWRLADAPEGSPVVITGATGGSGGAVLVLASLFGGRPLVAVSQDAKRLGVLGERHGMPLTGVAIAELAQGWETSGALTRAIVDAACEAPAAVIDFTPQGSAVAEQAIAALRPGGVAVLCAGNHASLNVKYVELMRNQITLRGMRGATEDDEQEAIRLLAAGHIDIGPLFTHHFPLRKIGDAFTAVAQRADSPAFVLVHT